METSNCNVCLKKPIFKWSLDVFQGYVKRIAEIIRWLKAEAVRGTGVVRGRSGYSRCVLSRQIYFHFCSLKIHITHTMWNISKSFILKYQQFAETGIKYSLPQTVPKKKFKKKRKKENTEELIFLESLVPSFCVVCWCCFSCIFVKRHVH